MKIIGRITGLVRRLNTPSGNPRWTVWIDGTPYATGNDSQVGLVLSQSWVGRQIDATVSGSTLLEVEAVSS